MNVHMSLNKKSNQSIHGAFTEDQTRYTVNDECNLCVWIYEYLPVRGSFKKFLALPKKDSYNWIFFAVVTQNHFLYNLKQRIQILIVLWYVVKCCQQKFSAMALLSRWSLEFIDRYSNERAFQNPYKALWRGFAIVTEIELGYSILKSERDCWFFM